MLNKQEVETYLALHNKMSNRISEIIEVYSTIADCWYDIRSWEAHENGIMTYLEYYKWQDTNEENIFIESDFLYDDVKLLELQNKAKDAKQKRYEEAEAKKKLMLEKKIEEARNLLAQYEK